MPRSPPAREASDEEPAQAPARRAVCRLEDGTALYVKILDVSVDGVAVDAPRRPAVGSVIHIGRQKGVIGRHTPRGFVVFYETAASQELPILRAV